MSDDPPASRERLLRELTWALDRHGCTIVERGTDLWLITHPRGSRGSLHVGNLISRVLELPTFSKQRKLIEESMRHINGGGGAGGAVSKD